MKLKKLIAKNFGTYEALEYDFVDQPMMVQGVNLTDDKQKSNGSGKSFIQTMIEFCITGDNSRGVRDVELIRFGCKEAFLDLFVTCDVRKEEIHINWKIKRKGSNVLQITRTKDGENWEEVVFSNVNDGKKWILKWFAISKEDIFNYFIINKTRFKSFFKSSNKEKVELINRFSDASIIDGIEEIDSEELDNKYDSLNTNITKSEGKLEVLNENLQKEVKRDVGKEYNDKVSAIKEENDDIDEEIVEIEKEIDEKKVLIKQKEELIVGINEDTKTKEGLKEGVQLEIDALTKQFDEVNVLLNEAQTKVNEFVKTDFESQRLVFRNAISKTEGSIELEEQALEKSKKQEESVSKIISQLSIKLSGTITCPKCDHEFLTSGGKTVEELKKNEFQANALKSSILKAREKVVTNIESLKVSLSEPKSSIKEVDKLEEKESESKTKLLVEVGKVNEKINKKNSELNALKTNLQNYVNSISNNETSITKEKNSISNYEQEIKGLENEIENYGRDKVANNNLLNSLKEVDNKGEIKGIKFAISVLQKEKISFEKELKEVEDKLYKINQWRNNFKEFKMFIANKSLETMEFHCNRYLTGMGSDLKAKFEGYKVLANGTIKDEITALVIREVERTFSSFSGGEQGRLLFSSILANRHMINNTHPYGGFHFLSIDEVFEGVDGLGLQSLVEEATKLQTCIMIITHVTDESVSGNVLKIVKRNGISKIE